MTTRPLSPARRVPIANPSHRFRDNRGRFRAGTSAERFALDTLDAQSAYFSGRLAGGAQQFGVFTGARTGRRFAVRRGAIVPLDGQFLARQLEQTADIASRYLLGELRKTSPVDSGLLRSRWQIADDAVVNDTPYVWATEYRNESSKGYIRRAVGKTLRKMARDGLPAARSRPQSVTIRL